MSPAFILAILLLLLSSLWKETIVPASLILALLSALTKIRTQHHKLEKLSAEYEGQLSINRAAAERHSIAYRKLLETAIPAPQKRGNTVCTRPHFDHPTMETVRVNKDLRQRAKDFFAENTALKAEREVQNGNVERLQRSVERLVERKTVLLGEIALMKRSVKER